jgi:hypothetical protein
MFRFGSWHTRWPARQWSCAFLRKRSSTAADGVYGAPVYTPDPMYAARTPGQHRVQHRRRSSARATIAADRPTSQGRRPAGGNQRRREWSMTSHNDGPSSPDGPSTSPPRRFSEGMERKPLAPSSSRVGRFSDGLARSPRSGLEERIGSFADGIAHRPNARSARRIGSFSDGLARAGPHSRTVPCLDSPRSSVEGRIAA